MMPFHQLLKVDKHSDVPVYLQLTNAFIHHIHQGTFRKSMRLPGSRILAQTLKINRMTVVAAYQELAAQGWIAMVPKKGTFVNVSPPLLKPDRISGKPAIFALPAETGFKYDANRFLPHRVTPSNVGKIVFNDGGFPDARLAPVEDLVRRIRSLSRVPVTKKYLGYGNPQGTLLLRETLADFLADTRGLSITADNILITKGAQMGIYLATSLIVRPGDVVIAGSPGYFGANTTFKQLGATVVQVPVDEDGIDVDAIEKIARHRKIRMLYVIPHHHHPTTATLTPARRVRLLDLASRYSFAIIEDDYDYDFHFAGKPMMPMAGIDRNGNVIYIGTLTKSLAPSIRLGFVVGPAAFVQSATAMRKTIDAHGDTLIENAVAEMYKDGTIARHMKKSFKLYRSRRDHFCTLLENELHNYVSFTVPSGGLSVWAHFKTHHLPDVSQRAFARGLVMGDGLDYNTNKIKYNAVSLGFASLNEREQDKAVDLLRTVLKTM